MSLEGGLTSLVKGQVAPEFLMRMILKDTNDSGEQGLAPLAMGTQVTWAH